METKFVTFDCKKKVIFNCNFKREGGSLRRTVLPKLTVGAVTLAVFTLFVALFLNTSSKNRVVPIFVLLKNFNFLLSLERNIRCHFFRSGSKSHILCKEFNIYF